MLSTRTIPRDPSLKGSRVVPIEVVVPFAETPDTVKAPGGKSGRGVSGRLARIPNLGNRVVPVSLDYPRILTASENASIQLNSGEVVGYASSAYQLVLAAQCQNADLVNRRARRCSLQAFGVGRDRTMPRRGPRSGDGGRSLVARVRTRWSCVHMLIEPGRRVATRFRATTSLPAHRCARHAFAARVHASKPAGRRPQIARSWLRV
jgi:hypothetical protein